MSQLWTNFRHSGSSLRLQTERADCPWHGQGRLKLHEPACCHFNNAGLDWGDFWQFSTQFVLDWPVRGSMFEEVGVVLPGRLNARDLLLRPAFHGRSFAVLGVLFAIRGSLAITSLSSIPVFLFSYFLPGVRVSRDLWLGIYVAFTICVHFTWLRMRRRLRRGARIRQGVMGFLDAYGLLRLFQRNTWSGTWWASHCVSTAGQRLSSVCYSSLFTFLSKGK
ncbi:hypothetical protein F5888DRAFT_232450 [Russula emetica]|nr:hypothetical protein F5888DRAFT_232450 [Russula emetica]